MDLVTALPRRLCGKGSTGAFGCEEGGSGPGPVATKASGGFGDGLPIELWEGGHAADDDAGGEFGIPVRWCFDVSWN